MKTRQEKAAAERKAGADKVVEQLIERTGSHDVKLVWAPDPSQGSNWDYTLWAHVGENSQGTKFTDPQLADYPVGCPATDDLVDLIVRWIKRQSG
jgi:hypothetical protein